MTRALGSSRLYFLLTEPGVYLTGSRYFGDAKDDADWDFFVTGSTKVGELAHRQWLQEDRFQR